MDMIKLFIQLWGTSIYDKRIQLKIELPYIPRKGEGITLGSNYVKEFAYKLEKNKEYLLKEYNIFSFLANKKTLIQ